MPGPIRYAAPTSRASPRSHRTATPEHRCFGTERKPIICAVNGVCAGLGFHFVMDSDIVVCTSNASFTDPHITMGQVSALEANNFFNNQRGLGNPLTHFNQYGASAGGPVWIPKVFNGRNKLFFFFAWESLKDAQPSTIITTVPTDAEKMGNFSKINNFGISAHILTQSDGEPHVFRPKIRRKLRSKR